MGIFSDINGNIVRLHPGELYNSGLEFFADKKMHFILVGRWIVTISIHIYKYIYIYLRGIKTPPVTILFLRLSRLWRALISCSIDHALNHILRRKAPQKTGAGRLKMVEMAVVWWFNTAPNTETETAYKELFFGVGFHLLRCYLER